MDRGEMQMTLKGSVAKAKAGIVGDYQFRVSKRDDQVLQVPAHSHHAGPSSGRMARLDL